MGKLLQPVIISYIILVAIGGFFFICKSTSQQEMLIREAMILFFLIFGFAITYREKSLFKNTNKDPRIIFDRLSEKSIIRRYRFLQIAIHWSLAILVIMAFGFLGIFAIENIGNDDAELGFENSIILTFAAVIMLPLSFFIGFYLIRYSMSSKPYFHLRYAQACFRISSKEKTEHLQDNLRHVSDGLNAYNQFLLASTGVNIQEYGNVILRILGDPKRSTNEKIKEMKESLDSEDSLEFLHYITNHNDSNKLDFVGPSYADKIWKHVLRPLSIFIGIIVNIIALLAGHL